MLAAGLGLVEGPLVRSFLLGEQHFLHRVVPAQRGDGQDDRVDGSDEGHAFAEAISDLAGLLHFRQLYLGHAVAPPSGLVGPTEPVELRAFMKYPGGPGVDWGRQYRRAGPEARATPARASMASRESALPSAAPGRCPPPG